MTPPPGVGGAHGLAPDISPRADSTGPRRPGGHHVTNLFDEVAFGDKRRALRALRRLLAERIAANPRPRDLAALTYRLMKVPQELDEDATRLRRSRNRPTNAQW